MNDRAATELAQRNFLAMANSHEFITVVVWPGAKTEDLLLGLPSRFFNVVGGDEPEFGPATVTFQIADEGRKALSDFTRVVEETGILDQERSQKDGSRDER